MSKYEELLERKNKAIDEHNLVVKEIENLQNDCGHVNADVTRERDGYELRYYNFHNCPDCGKTWYS